MVFTKPLLSKTFERKKTDVSRSESKAKKEMSVCQRRLAAQDALTGYRYQRSDCTEDLDCKDRTERDWTELKQAIDALWEYKPSERKDNLVCAPRTCNPKNLAEMGLQGPLDSSLISDKHSDELVGSKLGSVSEDNEKSASSIQLSNDLSCEEESEEYSYVASSIQLSNDLSCEEESEEDSYIASITKEHFEAYIVSSEEGVLPCPPICMNKLRHRENRSQQNYAHLDDEPSRVYASSDMADFPDIESFIEDEVAAEEDAKEVVEPYCLTQTDPECIQRLKVQIKGLELEVNYLEQTRVDLDAQVEKVKARKRNVLRNVMKLRWAIKEVDYQLMEARVESEMAAEPKPKPCKSRGKKLIKAKETRLVRIET